MKKLILKTALLLAAALALPMSANAVPTLVGPNDFPEGVDGLVVDGMTYDVTFSLSADPDQSDAPSLNVSNASTALADFFETQTITSWGLFGSEKFDSNYKLYIWLDYSRNIDIYGHGVSASYVSSGAPDYLNGHYDNWLAGDLQQGNQATLFGIKNGPGFTNASASFQAVEGVSPIPEPETYALMLAGLALVGTAARRRRVRA
jgi:hypothetical protein